MRSAVRPVTKVDPIWSKRSTSAMAEVGERGREQHRLRAVRDAGVDAGLHEVRTGQPGDGIDHDEHQTEQQRSAEAPQHVHQPEGRARARSRPPRRVPRGRAPAAAPRRVPTVPGSRRARPATPHRRRPAHRRARRRPRRACRCRPAVRRPAPRLARSPLPRSARRAPRCGRRQRAAAPPRARTADCGSAHCVRSARRGCPRRRSGRSRGRRPGRPGAGSTGGAR